MGSRMAPGRGTRLFVTSLVFALVASLVQLVGVAPAVAETLQANLVNEVDTSPWPPPVVEGREPSGVAYVPTPTPHLIVVDTNAPLAANAWEYVPATATPTQRLLGPAGIQETTGVAYDVANDRLFVSSDTPNRIYVVTNHQGTPTVTQIPLVDTVSGDTEDPAYDPATNTLYFLDGQAEQIHKVNMATNTVDPAFVIDLSQLSPEADGDWEAMAWNEERQTLVVAPNNFFGVMYEIPPTAGTPTQANNLINTAGISTNLLKISGLGMAPTTGNPAQMSYWIADRESSGIFEVSTTAFGQLAPIAYSRSLSVPFNTAVPANLVATDANNDALTYTIVSQPTHGTLNPSAPGGAARTYTPTAGYSGPDTFTFKVNDGTVDSNTATVTVNVHAQNTPPVLNPIASPVMWNELSLLSFAASATDLDGDALTFSLQNAPSGASITPTGNFAWLPTEEQGPGTYSITVVVTDSGGLTDSQVVQVNVQEVGGGGGGGGGGTNPFASIQTNAGFWRLYHGPAQVAGFYYGNPGDFGFMGDWNCDGIDTPGLYRRSDGYVYLRNSNTQGVADVAFFFGNPGDLPLAGDFDNNGCDTVSIYRPAEGKFYIMNHLGAGDAGLGAADFSYYFGNPGDAPFMGDWNGDGIDTPGLRRNSDGFVYLRHSNTQGVGEEVYFYGDSGDVVFTGDWDNDGDDTLGLYRPSNGTVYLRNTNTTGVADTTVVVGGGMQAVGGNF